MSRKVGLLHSSDPHPSRPELQWQGTFCTGKLEGNLDSKAVKFRGVEYGFILNYANRYNHKVLFSKVTQCDVCWEEGGTKGGEGRIYEVPPTGSCVRQSELPIHVLVKPHRPDKVHPSLEYPELVDMVLNFNPETGDSELLDKVLSGKASFLEMQLLAWRYSGPVDLPDAKELPRSVIVAGVRYTKNSRTSYRCTTRRRMDCGGCGALTRDPDNPEEGYFCLTTLHSHKPQPLRNTDGMSESNLKLQEFPSVLDPLTPEFAAAAAAAAAERAAARAARAAAAAAAGETSEQQPSAKATRGTRGTKRAAAARGAGKAKKPAVESSDSESEAEPAAAARGSKRGRGGSRGHVPRTKRTRQASKDSEESSEEEEYVPDDDVPSVSGAACSWPSRLRNQTTGAQRYQEAESSDLEPEPPGSPEQKRTRASRATRRTKDKENVAPRTARQRAHNSESREGAIPPRRKRAHNSVSRGEGEGATPPRKKRAHNSESRGEGRSKTKERAGGDEASGVALRSGDSSDSDDENRRAVLLQKRVLDQYSEGSAAGGAATGTAESQRGQQPSTTLAQSSKDGGQDKPASDTFPLESSEASSGLERLLASLGHPCSLAELQHFVNQQQSRLQEFERGEGQLLAGRGEGLLTPGPSTESGAEIQSTSSQRFPEAPVNWAGYQTPRVSRTLDSSSPVHQPAQSGSSAADSSQDPEASATRTSPKQADRTEHVSLRQPGSEEQRGKGKSATFTAVQPQDVVSMVLAGLGVGSGGEKSTTSAAGQLEDVLSKVLAGHGIGSGGRIPAPIFHFTFNTGPPLSAASNMSTPTRTSSSAAKPTTPVTPVSRRPAVHHAHSEPRQPRRQPRSEIDKYVDLQHRELDFLETQARAAETQARAAETQARAAETQARTAQNMFAERGSRLQQLMQSSLGAQAEQSTEEELEEQERMNLEMCALRNDPLPRGLERRKSISTGNLAELLRMDKNIELINVEEESAEAGPGKAPLFTQEEVAEMIRNVQQGLLNQANPVAQPAIVPPLTAQAAQTGPAATAQPVPVVQPAPDGAHRRLPLEPAYKIDQTNVGSQRVTVDGTRALLPEPNRDHAADIVDIYDNFEHPMVRYHDWLHRIVTYQYLKTPQVASYVPPNQLFLVKTARATLVELPGHGMLYAGPMPEGQILKIKGRDYQVRGNVLVAVAAVV